MEGRISVLTSIPAAPSPSSFHTPSLPPPAALFYSISPDRNHHHPFNPAYTLNNPTLRCFPRDSLRDVQFRHLTGLRHARPGPERPLIRSDA